MRVKIHPQTTLDLFSRTDNLKIVREFQSKYNRISEQLDDAPAILNAVHRDLAGWSAVDGRVSNYSSEQFLRVLIVKCIEGLSLRDTVIRIVDSAFLRSFCRLVHERVPNFTVIDTAINRIQPDTWRKINDILVKGAVAKGEITLDSIRADSTVCESNIHYPTDSSLLWDSWRVAARLMRQASGADRRLDRGNRFHDKKVKALHTFISTHRSRKNKSTQRKTRKKMSILIRRVAWITDTAMAFIAHGRTIRVLDPVAEALVGELERMISLFTHVVSQARRAAEGERVAARERIFSIFEPHTELLKRGKARKPIEFGHLVSIAQTPQKVITWYEVERQSRHDKDIGNTILADHRRRFGQYPDNFTADKNYYGGQEQQRHWEERLEYYAVGKKGRRNEDQLQREHEWFYRVLQKFRAGCEGSISVLKRVFGLHRCLYRGFKNFASSIGCLVLCHNLVVLSRK